MFDIGFWEIVLIAVIALFVVGPDEFPSLVRNLGRGLGKFRGFLSSVKSDLDYELEKADQLKERIRKETQIAELHERLLDEQSPTVPVRGQATNKAVENDELNEPETGQGAAQPLSGRGPDKHSK